MIAKEGRLLAPMLFFLFLLFQFKLPLFLCSLILTYNRAFYYRKRYHDAH